MRRKIINKTYRLKNFVKKDIWDMEMDDFSKAKARFLKYVKVLIIIVKTFIQQKIGPQAAALSYFTMLAAVPFLAIVFVITGGLGLEDKIQELLYMYFSDAPQAIDTVLHFAYNTLDSVKGGLMGFISAVVLLWFIIRLFIGVESALNDTWHVTQQRSAIKRITYYFITLLMAPFILLVFFSGSIIYTNLLNFFGPEIEEIGFIKKALSWSFYIIMTVLTFSAMYKFIPNYNVKYSNAFRAAVFAGIAFTLMQYIYLETQLIVSSWNGVYGTFAAVPLMMLWLNVSWNIILVGGEASYAFQHVDNYKIED